MNEYEKVTMKLIGDHVRAIAGKIKNKEKLTPDEQTYASNALIDYADRLERKSEGRSTGSTVGDDDKRRRVLGYRILKKHHELSEKPIEKKRLGRPKIKKE